MAKVKSIEYLEDKDILFDVPKNWSWVRIGSITDIVGGGTPSSSKEEYYINGDIPWIRPADLSNYSGIYISKGAKSITELGLVKSSARLLPADTLLLSSRAPIGYVAIAENELSTNQGFKNFKPSKYLNPHYGYWYLKYSKELLESMGTGTTFKELSGKKVATLPIPIPPFPEQQRIVTQIESLFEKIDKAEVLINEAREGFGKRKEAILAKAFRGELTERWRVNNHTDVNAYELYKRITSEEVKKKVKKLDGVKDRHILPESWDWYSIGEILNITSGGTPSRKKPEYYEGEIPWIKTGELLWNEIYDANERITEEAIKNSSAKLLPINSVLVAMYGQGLTRGRASILKTKASCNQAVCAILPSQYILPKYIYYFFMEGYWRFREEAQGGNQPNFSGKLISTFRFPLAPLEEQFEIIEILDKLLCEEKKIEELARLDKSIDSIKKSILAKAFRGELGTNKAEEEYEF